MYYKSAGVLFVGRHQAAWSASCHSHGSCSASLRFETFFLKFVFIWIYGLLFLHWTSSG